MTLAVAGVVLAYLFIAGQPSPGGENRVTPTYQNPYLFGLVNSAEQAGDVAFFSSYGLVLVAEFPDSNPFAAYRAQTPAIVLLGMTNPYFPTGFALYPEYTNPEKVRPGWVLRTGDGAVISYAGPRYANMADNPSMMDLRASEWQDEYIGFNKVLIEEFGLDGIVLDTWSSTLPVWARLNNEIAPAGYSDEGWGKMMVEFTRKFRDAIPDDLLIYNGLTVAPGEKGPGDIGYLETMDGAAYEAYSIYLAMDSSPQAKRQYFDHAIMNAMVRARGEDKYFLLQAAGDENNPQSRLFAYGAFLLNAYDKSFFYFDAGDEDAPNWFAEWNIDLGAPVGAAEHSGDIYLRRFEKGLVVVNAGDGEAVYPLEGTMLDSAGNEVSGKIVLQAFDAVILQDAPVKAAV